MNGFISHDGKKEVKYHQLRGNTQHQGTDSPSDNVAPPSILLTLLYPVSLVILLL